MLSWFEKAGDRLVGQAPLKGIAPAQLRRWFALPTDDPVYDSLPVGPEHAAKLNRYVDVPIDLHRYDYFIECERLTRPHLIATRK